MVFGSFWNVSTFLLLIVSFSFHLTPSAAVPIDPPWTLRNDTTFPGKSLSKRSTTNCAGDTYTLVQAGIVEARTMAQAAVTRTQNVYDYLNQSPVPYPSTLSAQDRSAFKTFETVFGQAFFGNLDSAADLNAAGLQRVSTILCRHLHSI